MLCSVELSILKFYNLRTRFYLEISDRGADLFLAGRVEENHDRRDLTKVLLLF